MTIDGPGPQGATVPDLDRLLRPGARVALADGVGSPVSLHAPLSAAAAGKGVDLVLGWHPGPTYIDPGSFSDVRVLSGGPGVRSMIDAGAVNVVPCRLSAIPALLAGPLRPDLLVATLVRGPGGLHLGAEASWMRGLIDAGVPVAATLSSATPRADSGPPIPASQVTVVAENDDPPAEIAAVPPTEADEIIARHVASLVPAGARIQVGPGRLAQAIVAALEVPVRFDSGQLPDPVIDLIARDLLIGTPTAAYLSGTRRLYEWANGRPLLHPIEVTHDIGRLSAGPHPLIAINTALEIDRDGQVNVEGIGRTSAGMIGGHPDFAAAGVRGTGLSVIALVSQVKGRPTLVEQLSRPTTTGSHDVDVVITERGIADLRGLTRLERQAALLKLWDAEIRQAEDPGRHP